MDRRAVAAMARRVTVRDSVLARVVSSPCVRVPTSQAAVVTVAVVTAVDVTVAVVTAVDVTVADVMARRPTVRSSFPTRMQAVRVAPHPLFRR